MKLSEVKMIYDFDTVKTFTNEKHQTKTRDTIFFKSYLNYHFILFQFLCRNLSKQVCTLNVKELHFSFAPFCIRKIQCL